MEDKKFYQKSWFMWTMLVFFSPLGLFLLWRYSNYSKKVNAIITGVFAFVIVIGMSSSDKNVTPAVTTTSTQSVEVKEVEKKENNLEKQKEVFSAWYTNLMADTKKVDEDWIIWEKTFTALGNGTIDRYQAYSNLKALSSLMYSHHMKFQNYSIPTELSKEQQDKLKKSMEALSSWTYYRQEACDNMNELLDNNNFKPSELDKIKNQISRGDSLMMGGLTSLLKIQYDLGLLEKSN